LVDKVKTKLQGGRVTEAALADELKEFDALLAQHRETKTDDVAQILLMKAMLYLQVLDDNEKGVKLLEQVETDYPDSSQAGLAKSFIQSARMQAKLAVGKTFPDFEVKDLEGKPFSVAQAKTKVAQEYGINSIPATFLVDAKGLILAKDLRGEALSQAVAKALAAD
jgi:hypothetical protein